MATKKAKTTPSDQNTDNVERNRQSAIEDRRKAKEEAEVQVGVEPPENADINVPSTGVSETAP